MEPQSIDEYFVSTVAGWCVPDRQPEPPLPSELCLRYFDAQVQSRHLDFAARWMQSRGGGFYTIGSAGHESNAALGLTLRVTDPALLHYRSGGFYAARAALVPGTTPIRDVLAGVAAATADPISGGRHKVFGHRGLNIIPQTSTIASHLPRAVGVAFAIARAARLALPSAWPPDSVVVCSFGDASANHSTAVGALNSAAYCAHRGIPLPLLFVCEDNGIGISTRTPPEWLERALPAYPGVRYRRADGFDPEDVFDAATELVGAVRGTRRPGILHLKTVRFMGHAGSDVELSYRTHSEIRRDYDRDPLLGTARFLVRHRMLTPRQVLDRYESARAAVMDEARSMVGSPRLTTAEQVMQPLTERHPERVEAVRVRAAADAERSARFDGRLPEREGPLTLAQTINAALTDAMAAWPDTFVFGEDVALEGGVYGVTRGLQKRFGPQRVFDTVLDEQTILGTALGLAVSGLLPIPEIQYLAYLHNAEDQLRGEGASLRFFSNGQYRNGMVVRVAGLAYQKGFGGHFHNDNAVAVLRDIPGLVLAVPSHPAGAPALVRSCVALAREEGRVCVLLEPIALYHNRDLHDEGDGEWTAPYAAPVEWSRDAVPGRMHRYGSGTDVLLVTFGNGVRMSIRGAKRLSEMGIGSTVADLQWLAPLPEQDLLEHASWFRRVLVVDETRRSGGVSEGVVAALVDAGYEGSLARVASRDSYVPLGPAAESVLLSERDIVAAAVALMG